MYEKIKTLKLLLHKYFYNPNNLQPLINSFQNEFDLFSIDYDNTTKIIQIKIKKTNMKKIQNYSHSSLFYYSIINPLITNFLSNYCFEVIKVCSPDEYHELESLYDPHNVSLLYNITVIGDNIINIQL